ncbi:hypothetical protein [Colwellia echini]|uniref:Uncharacterized protein n=1 Tax=Colwellia echini TaxID=1982103 RepID=A0ABY3N025_9GAMM|nr:hypothetical protein [Colwellia echini]TYK66612.1 hypothetical protein CWS31_004565 [Colwellia echini]
MVDNNKLSKDVEEQIQSLASDVYIQVEEKLTHLITTAVKAELSKNTVQQSKDLSAKEQLLQKSFTEQQQLQSKEIDLLKQTLAEKTADVATAKQDFQVELTQQTINYTETIEGLQKEINNLKQNSKQQNEKQSSDNNLEEKLLEAEQELNDKTHEIDGLKGRIMVLTEQEQSLAKQLANVKQSTELNEKQKNETIAAIKAQAEASAKQQIDVLNEKIKQFDTERTSIKAEAEKNAAVKVKELEQKIAQLAEQVQQEQNGKAELQQQLSAQQKAIDTEQDKNKQAEQRDKDYQAQIVKITEQANLDKQPLLDQIKALKEGEEKLKQQQLEEIKAINKATEEAKILQSSAQQNIIELEKKNIELTKKLEAEQKDVQLYQQEVMVLNEQLKVAQDGQESILQRFNSNRDKQEIENNKVRDTIKFLRDENHQLISATAEQKTEFTAQLNELEHKLTEYRLKFEYAQKQLAN